MSAVKQSVLSEAMGLCTNKGLKGEYLTKRGNDSSL
jgi:hypothetical protein